MIKYLSNTTTNRWLSEFAQVP